LTDAFYIGGTKNGALLGEALVICRDSLKEDFRFHMKQKGALLAKGRVLGQQFLTLFTDDLYFELAEHANQMAERIRTEISQAGYAFLTDSPTNQIFPILPNDLIAKLQGKYSFYIWAKVDFETSAVRLVTSWATREDAVEQFLQDYQQYRQSVATSPAEELKSPGKMKNLPLPGGLEDRIDYCRISATGRNS
jgi:threonine aldolase